jgi:hypothetical protein
LQLEAPAYGFSAFAGQNQDRRKSDKTHHYAERVSPAVNGQAASVSRGKAHDLDGEDREHAGHEVEDNSAQHGEQNRLP